MGPWVAVASCGARWRRGFATSRGRRVLDPELVAAALDTGASPLTPPRKTDVLRATPPSDRMGCQFGTRFG